MGLTRTLAVHQRVTWKFWINPACRKLVQSDIAGMTLSSWVLVHRYQLQQYAMVETVKSGTEVQQAEQCHLLLVDSSKYQRRIQAGVQGVRIPASLIRCPFLKRTYCENGRRFVGFWASGGANFPKWEISCPGCPWTIVQNLTLLALSPAEKSVTVQSDKFTNKQTNSNRHIHTAYSMCGNDNQRLKLNKNSVGQHQLSILTQIDP